MRLSSRFQHAIGIMVVLGCFLLPVRTSPQLQMSVALRGQEIPTPSSSPSPSSNAAKHAAPEFFVMIDPSHGGDDKGAMLAGGKVPEKEVSLALARELKRQLEERGIGARLLRNSDVNLSLEQRASATNEARPGIYVALHAGQPGKGVRVYSSAMELAQPSATGRFLPWEAAQTGSLERSRAVARMVASELHKTGLPVARLATSLRPLNNLITPAIAVEWAPGPADLRPPQAQKLGNMLASAIASGIVQSRGQGAER